MTAVATLEGEASPRLGALRLHVGLALPANVPGRALTLGVPACRGAARVPPHVPFQTAVLGALGVVVAGVLGGGEPYRGAG